MSGGTISGERDLRISSTSDGRHQSAGHSLNLEYAHQEKRFVPPAPLNPVDLRLILCNRCILIVLTKTDMHLSASRSNASSRQRSSNTRMCAEANSPL